MLTAAVASCRRGSDASRALECEVVAPTEIQTALRGEIEGTIVFISVSEADLSKRGGTGADSLLPCESLSIAQAVARDASAHSVYLLRHSDAPALTGVDELAAILGGIAGITDDRALLEDGVMSALIAHRFRDRRSRSMLVVGRSATCVRELKATLEKWEQSLDGDGTLDPACWRAAMALAQLDRLLPIRGTGDRYSFVKLARALNVQKGLTFNTFGRRDKRGCAGDYRSAVDPSLRAVAQLSCVKRQTGRSHRCHRY
jgi:hypothetical protein